MASWPRHRANAAAAAASLAERLASGGGAINARQQQQLVAARSACNLIMLAKEIAEQREQDWVCMHVMRAE